MSINKNLQSIIDNLNTLSSSNLTNSVKQAMGNIQGAIDTVGAVAADTGDKLGGFLAEFTEGVSGAQAPVEALSRGAGKLGDSLKELGTAAAAMGLGNISAGVQSFGEIMGGTIQTVADLNKQMVDASESFDQGSSRIRAIEGRFGELGIRMGMSFKETQKFNEEFMKIMSSSDEDFFIHPAEIGAVTEALMEQAISFEELTESINTSMGAMSKQESVILLSKATGESYSTIVRNITDSMRELGMSFEASVEQYGIINSLTAKTGLTFDETRDAITGAVNGFEKLGVNMGFAEPMFASFARSLEKVGLGLKQTASLARSFTQSLLGAVESADKMFLMQSRGGGNFGAGGLFGAQIGMQARLLEAKTPEEQQDIGMEMVSSLKESLASFTGGEIITVQEAARSPELQATFEMQRQVLGQLSGVTGYREQARVLEMLQQLDEGFGDTVDAEKELVDLMQQGLEKEDKTLPEAEKTARNTAGLLAQMTIGNELTLAAMRASEQAADKIGSANRAAIRATSAGIRDLTSKVLSGADVAEKDITSILDREGVSLNQSKITESTIKENERRQREERSKVDVDVNIRLAPGAEKLIDASSNSGVTKFAKGNANGTSTSGG